MELVEARSTAFLVPRGSKGHLEVSGSKYHGG